MTSPPSARPLVSLITAPTIAPIAFWLPARTCSAASGSASIAASTIASSSPRPRSAPRPSRSTISAGSPPSATSRRAPACRRRARSASPRPCRPAPPAPRASTFDSAGRPRSPASRSAAASSPVTQLATTCGSSAVGRRASAALEVGAELGVEGELARGLLGAARARSRSARAARPGSSGSASRAAREHLLGRRQRHQVGLGEVAVVVRVLLRAQRGEDAVARVEVERLLLDLLAAPRAARAWRSSSASIPRSRKRKLFMFLSSVLVPSSLAAGRAHRDVGVARAGSPPPC